jgi:hypothetical protein
LIEVGEGGLRATHRVMLAFNPSDTPLRFALPDGSWRRALNTSTAEFDCEEILIDQCDASRSTVMVFVQDVEVALPESIQ